MWVREKEGGEAGKSLNGHAPSRSLVSCPPGLLLVALLCLALPARAQPPGPPRAALLLCNGLTADDLQNPALPRLRALARSGQIGLMNTALAGPKTDHRAEQAVLQGRVDPDEVAGLEAVMPGAGEGLRLRVADREALERLLASLSPDHTRLLIVSPRPPLGARGRWQPRLTLAVAAGPGLPHGLLTSATTRTPGLIANIDIAPTGLAWLGRLVSPEMTGHPVMAVASARPLAAIDRLDRRVTVNMLALDPVFIALGVLAALVVFGGLLALRVYPSAARLFAFAWLGLMNMPSAMLLAPLLDLPFLRYSLSPYRSSAALMGTVLALMAGLAGAQTALAARLRRPASAPCLLAARFTVLLLLLDAFCGQPLVKFSLLSSYQLAGIRYYGIGNEYLGILLGSMLLAAFLGRWPATAAGGAFLFVAFVVSYPGLGANAGGLVAAAVAFGIGWRLLRGRRATWQSAAVWTLLGLAATFGLALLDRFLASGAASHAGDALRAAGARGYGYLGEIIARKLRMNAHILIHPGVLAALAGLAILFLLLRRTLGPRTAAFLARHPDWARGLPAVGWGVPAAFLFKDSGTVVALFLFGSYGAAGLYALLVEPSAEDRSERNGGDDMGKRAGMALLLAALAMMGGAARAEVQATRIAYHGWKGAYRLTNGTVEVVVVPQIGRIMRYGYLNGPNALWENPKLRGKTLAPTARVTAWTNFGGDKLWPAPQAKWGFPPDPFLDGYPHTAVLLPGNRLRLTSPVSRKHGIRFSREISLAPAGTAVTIRNTMENMSDQDVEWSVWEVAQVNEPEAAMLPAHAGGRFARGWYVFRGANPAPGMLTVRGGEVRLRRHPQKSAKIGADSRAGWAAARVRGLRFTVSATYEPGETYPDDGCAQEVWSNPNPDRYMELELLSPLRFLQPEDRYTFVTRWKLERVR